MLRTARSAPGGFYIHVLNCGNHRAEVFHEECDDDRFVDLRAEALAHLPIRLVAFLEYILQPCGLPIKPRSPRQINHLVSLFDFPVPAEQPKQ